MKDKVLIFIMGLLVGAIIATAICYVHQKNLVATMENVSNNSGDTKENFEMKKRDFENGTPPELPSGENDSNRMTPPSGENGTPPELPNGEMPPQMPSDLNTQNSSDKTSES